MSFRVSEDRVWPFDVCGDPDTDLSAETNSLEFEIATVPDDVDEWVTECPLSDGVEAGEENDEVARGVSCTRVGASR